MNKPNEKIEVAKITSRQVILVAIITAVAGLATGYFGKQTDSGGAMTSKVTGLETQIVSLQKDLKDSSESATQARNDLQSLKQRVRDILGPKSEIIGRMKVSLERMKFDSGVSQDHRERLAEIAQQLDKIDDKVLGLAEK